MGAPFLVLGMPRSRTAWLARFLTYGGVECLHEPEGDFRALLNRPGIGISDSNLTVLWREIVAAFPAARTVAVRRPIAEVWGSLRRRGYSAPTVRAFLTMTEGALTEIEQHPGVLTVSFDSLAHEDVCRRVFEHCLQVPFDRAWWAALAGVNVQRHLYNPALILADREIAA